MLRQLVKQLTCLNSQGNSLFTSQWLTGKIKKCHGCASNIRADTSAVPKPPYDQVV